MGKRIPRHAKILDLVHRRSVSSQQELARLLRREGFAATQSTLSRDIREIGLVKARGRYRLPSEVERVPEERSLRRTIRELVVRSAASGNIVMLKTPPGNAHSLGVVLDASEWPEVLGSVAGDDTVFLLLSNQRVGKRVMRRIRGYLA
jgi:transcriptional regulator of arginine metabolism